MQTRNPLVVLLTAVIVGSLALVPEAMAGSPAPGTGGGCKAVRTPLPRIEHLHRPPQTVSRSDRLMAIVKTNCGRFQIELDARRSPRIVNSFVYMVRSGFYRGLPFYRVVPNFVIQAGDPRAEGTGGPGYTVTEPPPKHLHYRLGTVAMAKAYNEPAGRAGSIFFVCAGQGRYIKNEYAVLGQVQAGIDTIKRIAALGSLPDEEASQTVKIDWIKIRNLGRADDHASNREDLRRGNSAGSASIALLPLQVVLKSKLENSYSYSYSARS
jgi:cyclophilin family peptidyl-prolyl cis-trans isomerase